MHLAPQCSQSYQLKRCLKMHAALLSSYFVVSLLLISHWYIAYTPPRPITCTHIVFHPGVFNISQSTFNKHAICSAPQKCTGGHFLYLFPFLLLNASDCHLNPGPRTDRFPCGECGRACTWSRTVRSVSLNIFIPNSIIQLYIFNKQ